MSVSADSAHSIWPHANSPWSHAVGLLFLQTGIKKRKPGMFSALSHWVFSGLQRRWNVPRILWYHTWASVFFFRPKALQGLEQSISGLLTPLCILSTLFADQAFPAIATALSKGVDWESSSSVASHQGTCCTRVVGYVACDPGSGATCSWQANLLFHKQKQWAGHRTRLGRTRAPTSQPPWRQTTGISQPRDVYWNCHSCNKSPA